MRPSSRDLLAETAELALPLPLAAGHDPRSGAPRPARVPPRGDGARGGGASRAVTSSPTRLARLVARRARGTVQLRAGGLRFARGLLARRSADRLLESTIRLTRGRTAGWGRAASSAPGPRRRRPGRGATVCPTLRRGGCPARAGRRRTRCLERRRSWPRRRGGASRLRRRPSGARRPNGRRLRPLAPLWWRGAVSSRRVRPAATATSGGGAKYKVARAPAAVRPSREAPGLEPTPRVVAREAALLRRRLLRPRRLGRRLLRPLPRPGLPRLHLPRPLRGEPPPRAERLEPTLYRLRAGKSRRRRPPPRLSGPRGLSGRRCRGGRAVGESAPRPPLASDRG